MPTPHQLLEYFFANPSEWGSIVPFLTVQIRIPDLSTRRGLRKVHAQIDRVYTELDSFHQLGKARNSPQLLAGVVTVLVKMCADSILKEKLIDKGLIDKVIDLLEHDFTRYMGLRILLVFIHDGSRMQSVVLEKIAGHSRTISRLVQEWGPDERNATELAVLVIAHSVRFMVSNLAPTAGHRIQDMEFHGTMQDILTVLRRPDPSKSLLTHGIMLLVTPVQYFPAICKTDPVVNTILVALLRAKDISIRVTALEGILNICTVDSELDTYEVDLPHLAQTVKYAESSAADLSTLENYPQWVKQSESSLLYRLSNQYIEAMSQAVRDRDLSALGRSIAGIVQRSASVVEGSWSQLEEDLNCEASHRLPCELWSDVLPECAKVLRLNGAPCDLDAADILDMKYLMLRSRVREAIAVAQMARSRNPNHVYARYVVSLCGDTAEGLRAAEEGLACPNVTPFLRKQMLWRAVECGVLKGVEQIVTAEADDQAIREEGVASLRTALDNVKTFLTATPPDAHLRLTMLGWCFLLEMALRGPELSDDLQELKDIRHQVEAAKTTMRFFGYTIHTTRVHEACNLILRFNDASRHDWGSLIASCDELEARAHCSGSGTEHRVFMPETDDELLPEVYIEMKKCSWCEAPSAILKKCKGCGEARYCDTRCQRPHWTEHKLSCPGRRRIEG